MQAQSQEATVEALSDLLTRCVADCHSKGYEGLKSILQDYTSALASSTQQQQQQQQVIPAEALTAALGVFSEQLGSIAADLSVVRVQVAELSQQAEWQTRAIRGLILGEARAPTLFIVVPDAPVAKLEKLKRLFLVSASPPLSPFIFSSAPPPLTVAFAPQDKSRLYCVCPVTLMPSPSSYVISNLKGWLVKLAPILHISLCVLKVALTAYGIPLPIPHLIGSALSPFETSLSLHFLDETAAVLSDYLKEKANEAVQDVIEDINESLSALTQANPSDAVIRRHSRRLQEATATQAEEFHRLLFSLEKVSGEKTSQLRPA